MSPDPKPDKSNQATILKPDGETTEALSALGQSVGVVALGKKVVLIEGRDSSLDTKVYGTLAQRRHPDLILVPSESRSDLENFDRLNEGVLKRTLWGVQFFMLADRDCTVATEAESTRFRILPRYHLENYFLDSEILAECFRIQEPDDSWLRQAAQIEARLHAIAMSKRSYAAYLIASSAIRRQAGNVSVKPSNVHEMNKPQLLEAARDKAIAEKARFDQALASEHVLAQFDSAYAEVEAKLESGDAWKIDIPAKQILAQFCSEANIQAGRLKNLYIELALQQKPEVFQDIFDVLGSFSEA